MVIPEQTLALACGLLFAAACSSQAPPASDGGTSSDIGIGTGADGAEGQVKLDTPQGTATMSNVSDGEATGCARVIVMVRPEIPTIILQVDQSGSMDADFSGRSRWDALYETLMGPAGVVESLQAGVRFGLAMYSSEEGFVGGVCPMLTEAAPALDNYDAIDAVYAPAQPIDDTPTGESLDLVAASLDAYPEPGPKAIVLATDGEPDTCAEPNPQNGQPETIAAVQGAFEQEIQTFVVSVGDEVGLPHLQEVANAGVGKPVNDPNPAPYYVALDPGDLIDAFNAIIGGFISCDIPIDGIVDLTQACEGVVVLDGTQLECPTDWEMLDASTLRLLGDACLTIKDGKPHDLDASWPCGAVSIP